MTSKLSHLLSITFHFPVAGIRQQISTLPELQLICLLIIAVKLYHPFDNQPRYARSLADPAALTINWAAWVEARTSAHFTPTGDYHLKRGSEIDVTADEAMNMTGDQLDEYMDWYQRTFIDESRVEQKSRGLPTQLLDMFPTGRADGSAPPPYDHSQAAAEEDEAIGQKLKTVSVNQNVRDVVPDDSEESSEISDEQKERLIVARVGSYYKRYRRMEDLTPHAKAFHEAATEAVGVQLETLLLAVGQVERKLMKWKEAKLKADKEKDSSITADDSSDRDD